MKQQKIGREAGEIDSQIQLEHMIDQYQNLIFTICFRFTNNYFDAEDLTQETFLSAYRNMEQFDGENLKAWLCKIAKNKCLDFKKSASSRLIPTQDQFFLTEQTENLSEIPERACLEMEVKDELYEACSKLEQPYQEVAHAFFLEERSVEEIARSLNRNEKTLRTQIYRAKGMLRKLYGKGVLT
ncbi:MAG: sigma-70 family RNA polymerase sigma factor [Clostridia bacterium]|nr:sigma-70 family RNA polymerase sigma factor [Clostridia bacterium]